MAHLDFSQKVNVLGFCRKNRNVFLIRAISKVR